MAPITIIFSRHMANSTTSTPKTIDEYIARYPEDVRDILQSIRATIRKAAPEAEETIKYQMPTFTLNGNLIHFGAFKKHIGMYPVPRGVPEFDRELAAYEGETATARFPLDKPMPLDLIARIIEFRVDKSSRKRVAKK
jgi:uncharacterized protein YdhG (YjbR/CyaY superfamily)